MKKNISSGCVGIFISLFIVLPSNATGQSEKAVVKKYLSELPKGTIQEIQVKGMDNKFLVKTIREIRVDKIK